MVVNNRIQSVERALDVLEMLAQSGNGLRVTDVAQRLNVRAPTAHNFLRTLAQRGYVQRIENPVRYKIGAAVSQLVRAGFENSAMAETEAAVAALSRRHPAAVISLTKQIGGDLSMNSMQ